MSQNGNNKTPITCGHCQQRFSVAIPPGVIFNDLRVSTLVVPHEKPVKCLCGKLSVIALGACQMNWTVIPLNDEQAASFDESSIVIPPPGMRLVH